MICLVCGEDKERAVIYQDVKIFGGIDYRAKFKISRHICDCCFKPESVIGLKRNNILNVDMTCYKEDVDAKNWEKQGLRREDAFSMDEVTDIMMEHGLVDDKIDKEKDFFGYRKIGYSFIYSRRDDYLFRVPSCYLNKGGESRDDFLNYKDEPFIKKEDFNKLLEKKNIKYVNKVDGVPFEQDKLKQLINLGYAIYDRNGCLKFAENRNKGGKACDRCGDIKNWSQFYYNKAFDIHTSKCVDCFKIFYQDNQERIKARQRAYHKTEKGKRVKKQYELNNPGIKVAKNLRKRLSRFLKSSNGKKFSKAIGMNSKDLKLFLETQFQIYGEWMSWDNYGSDWHIDHIIPISVWDEYKYILPSYFDGMGPNCFINLRPYPAVENISRGNQVDFEEINDHYLKMRELFPLRGFGPINLDKLDREPEVQLEQMDLGL